MLTKKQKKKQKDELLSPALPDGTDRMDNKSCSKSISFGHLRLADFAAMKEPAFRKQLRARRAMNCTVDPASAKQ